MPRLLFKKGTYKKVEGYKNVSSYERVDGVIVYVGKVWISGQPYQSKHLLSSREAALWVDKKRIEHKLMPINILKSV